jgi:hypothetical protein
MDACSVFRGPSGSRPGFPEPLVDRGTLRYAPVRETHGRRRDPGPSTGLSTNRPIAARFVDKSGRARAAADRSAERAAHDVDDLVDVLVGLAALGGGAHAALDVVLEDDDR